MAATKTVNLPYYQTGSLGLYTRVQQVTTSLWLDDTDGVFRAVPALFNVPLVESSDIPSVYVLSENRTVWANGEYQAYGYDAGNNLFAGAVFYILGDIEVSLSTLLEYTELIKKIEEGSWELVGNTWIYYDTDGSTPLMTFATKDASGNPTMTNIFKRVRL